METAVCTTSDVVTPDVYVCLGFGLVTVVSQLSLEAFASFLVSPERTISGATTRGVADGQSKARWARTGPD